MIVPLHDGLLEVLSRAAALGRGGRTGWVFPNPLDLNAPYSMPALILEYEDVLKRPGILGDPPVLSGDEVDVVLDALCAMSVPVLPWFRFRPFLNDPKDDHVIECAMAASARIVVSSDKVFRHGDVSAFGLKMMTARDYVYEMDPERRMR